MSPLALSRRPPSRHTCPLQRLATPPVSGSAPPPQTIRCAPAARGPRATARWSGGGCASARAQRPPGPLRDGTRAALAAQLPPAGLRLPARPELRARLQAREADRQGADPGYASPREGLGPRGAPGGAGRGVRAQSRARASRCAPPGLTSACAACRREFGVWGRLAGLAPGSVLYRSHGAAAEAGLWRLVLWPWVVRPGVWTCTRVLQVSSFL